MILMNDFRAEPPEIREEMLGAVARVLESGWYVLGSEVGKFEKAWAGACGAGHGIGVGNGMDAIEIALRALGIGEGDEVVTTAMTAFATVLAIIRAGAQPVLADIDPETALLSQESVKRCLSPKTRAVVVVHLYGQLRNMSAWTSFCHEHGVTLVEDCAQAHLAEIDGRSAGSFGSAGAYSFYPTKNLGAIGDAGMIVTDNAALSDKARSLRNYGQSTRYHHPDIGLNSRLDEIQAAILSVRLKVLPEFTDRRRGIAIAYEAGLSNGQIELLAAPQSKSAHVYHLYVICAERRDALQEHLNRCGVQTFIHYPVPMHQQKPCLGLKRDPRGLAASEHHAQSCLSLPCHPQMSEADVRSVIDAVNSFEA
jgi:dTDP-4-amino-4,6-dideoxygalactose transaminase